MKPREIKSIEDIRLLVDSFYSQVRKDPVLGDIFNNTIQDHWSEHLDKLYRFWETLLLGNHTYFGSPFVPHAKLSIEKNHFDRWIELFNKTIDEHFIGEKAVEAKWRAQKMAEMFHYKLEYFKKNSTAGIL
jgi:hemoglobin